MIQMFQYVLSIAPDKILSPGYKSGGMKFNRSVSNGTQEFGTNRSLYPVTQPVIKNEAFAQTCGIIIEGFDCMYFTKHF